MRSSIPKEIFFIHCIFGLIDFLTGLVLVFYPFVIFNLLHLDPYPNNFIYISYIGIFVMLTGVYYVLPFVPWKQSILKFSFHHIWVLTSIARMAVAIFIIVSFLSSLLSQNWLLIAASDSIIALIQIFLIKKYTNG